MKVMLCDLITISAESLTVCLALRKPHGSMPVRKTAGVGTMLRIRGTIGDLPVDLTLELDDGDWARLRAQLQDDAGGQRRRCAGSAGQAER